MRLLLIVSFIAACGHAAPLPPRSEPLLKMGNSQRRIVTSSPVAQQHFNAGLDAIYAFNYDEAAFQLAAAMRADSRCAMCAWGFALAAGPNINAFDKQGFGAHAAAKRAAALANDPLERALADALVARYAPAEQELGPPIPAAQRDKLSRAYADAMRAVARRFDDDDVLVLAAEALLLTTPRFTPNWTRQGAPSSPAVPEAQALIERVLGRSPDHVGAIHFYIHILDNGPLIARAVPHAARLAKLAPDAGHLVHMPAHVYLALGRYAEAEDANLAAIAADARYLERVPPGVFYELFASHPEHYLWYVHLWQGKRVEARKRAANMHHHAHGDPMAHDLVAALSAINAARFGDWDDALALEPRGSMSGVGVHFARGLAHVARGAFTEAAKEVASLEALIAKKPEVSMDMGPHADMLLKRNAIIVANGLALVAQLQGAIAFARGDRDRAITLLEQAIVAEAAIPPEGELRMFPLPARHRLGAMLLAMNRAADAERVYREDLAESPSNGWALFGLASALDAQRKPEATATWEVFRASWSRADVTLVSSNQVR